MYPLPEILEYGVRSTVPLRGLYCTVLIRILKTVLFRTDSVMNPYHGWTNENDSRAARDRALATKIPKNECSAP